MKTDNKWASFDSIIGRYLLIFILAAFNLVGTLEAAANPDKTDGFNQSHLASARPDYPLADSPRRAIELWTAAYVQRDFETLVHYMHPEALEDFKKQVILMSWELGKDYRKKEFVSILKGVDTLADMEKLNPREIFFAFLKSLTISPVFLEKLKQTKISVITHLEEFNDLFHFFLRVYPPIYANSSRLVTVSVKSYRSQWRVLLSSWLEELVFIRLKDFARQRDLFYVESLHDQIERLGSAATRMIVGPMVFKDKTGISDMADKILKNKNIFRLIILDNELNELLRKEKKEKPLRNWEREFYIQYKDEPCGQLVLSYGSPKDEEVNFSADSDVEAVGVLALDALLGPFLFNDKNGIREVLQFLLKSDRIQKVWVQKGKVQEWVSIGQAAGEGNGDIMAFEIDPGDKNSSIGILFIQYSK